LTYFELTVKHTLVRDNRLLKIVDHQMSLAVVAKRAYPITKVPCDAVYSRLNLLSAEHRKITPEVRCGVAGLHGENRDIGSKIVQSPARAS